MTLVTLGDKKKGRNHDLSVAEYKVQQELQNLQKVESQKQFLETSVVSARQKLTNLKLQYDEMDEEIQLDLTDKKKMVESLDTQLETKKLVLEITDEELKQKSSFLNYWML
jgi:chromosome segregation ATPase